MFDFFAVVFFVVELFELIVVAIFVVIFDVIVVGDNVVVVGIFVVVVSTVVVVVVGNVVVVVGQDGGVVQVFEKTTFPLEHDAATLSCFVQPLQGSPPKAPLFAPIQQYVSLLHNPLTYDNAPL